MKYNLHSYFRLNGFGITKKLEEADYIVVITCAAVKYREDLGANYILNVVGRKKRKAAKIVVMGCLPGVNRGRLAGEEDIVQMGKEAEWKDKHGFHRHMETYHVPKTVLYRLIKFAAYDAASVLMDAESRIRMQIKFPETRAEH